MQVIAPAILEIPLIITHLSLARRKWDWSSLSVLNTNTQSFHPATAMKIYRPSKTAKD